MTRVRNPFLGKLYIGVNVITHKFHKGGIKVEAKKGKALSGLLVVLLVSSLLVGLNVFAQEGTAPEEQAPQVPLFGTISGDVRDVDNNPITNVTVYLTNDTITTFEDAEAAGLALVGPDVSKLFPVKEVTEGTEVAVEPVPVPEEQAETAPRRQGTSYSLAGLPLIGSIIRMCENIPLIGMIFRICVRLVDLVTCVSVCGPICSRIPLIGSICNMCFGVEVPSEEPKPVTPVTPVKPVTPVAPVAPVTPVTPVAPVIVTPGVGEIAQPSVEAAHYVLKNVPAGTYSVNARALRADGKVISGRALNVTVAPLATSTADVVLDVARPYSMVISAHPVEVSAYLEGIFAEPETVEVKAQLLDYFSQPVGLGYEVTFSADAGTIPMDPVMTNETGMALATYTADTPVAGDVLITATYVDPETLIVISANTTIRLSAPTGTISGMVTDGYNNLLAGVNVELYLNGEPATFYMGSEPAVITTNANGGFTFQNLVPNAAGEFYEVRVSSERTATVGKAKAVVEVGYTTTANVVLPLELAPGNVEGQVTDSVGNPVSGAEVSIEGVTPIMSDEEGNFAFHGLYPGDYTVAASAKGETAEELVTVVENETVYVTVVLPIVPPKLDITAPENVTEGDSFNVTVSLNGQPVSGAVVTIGDQMAVTKADGVAQLKAPDVESDQTLTMTASSAEADGSADILVKNRAGIPGFEAIVALLAIGLAGAVVALRRRKR